MSTTEAVKLYQIGKRGRPVPGIGPGDLADPYQKPYPYLKAFVERAVALFWTMVDIFREARELETRMMNQYGYRRGEV